MPVIRRPRAQQPPQPRIATGHPLSRDLVFCAVGGSLFDLSSNIAATTTGVTRTADAQGLAHTRTDILGRLSFGAAWNRLAGASSAAIELLIKFDSVAFDQKILAKWGGAASDRSYLVEVVDGGNIGFIVGDGTRRSGRKTPGSSLVTGVWYHIVWTWSAPSTHEIFVNGVSQTLTDWASSSEASFTTILSDTTAPHQLFGDSSSGDASVRIALARAWRRRLPDEEVRTLWANPWQLFEPRSIYVWMADESPPAAGIARITMPPMIPGGWGRSY